MKVSSIQSNLKFVWFCNSFDEWGACCMIYREPRLQKVGQCTFDKSSWLVFISLAYQSQPSNHMSVKFCNSFDKWWRDWYIEREQRLQKVGQRTFDKSSFGLISSNNSYFAISFPVSLIWNWSLMILKPTKSKSFFKNFFTICALALAEICVKLKS